MSKHEPRSIEKLEDRLKTILTGQERPFGEAVSAIDVVHDEAWPYTLQTGIDAVIKVVDGKRADVVLMHATMKHGTDRTQVVVHPLVAAYYDRKRTIEALAKELQRADRAADWDRAAAVAEATIQVLDQQIGNQPSATEIPRIETGRLGRARPEVEKRLSESYANTTQHVLSAAATAGAARLAGAV